MPTHFRAFAVLYCRSEQTQAVREEQKEISEPHEPFFLESMQFNRKQFFDGVRKFLRSNDKSLTQGRTDAFEFLITSFERQSLIRSIPEIAYCFATISVETDWTYAPIKEIGPDSYFKKYNGRSDLGNTEKGDGPRFKGRGYTQITGRSNYTKFAKLLGCDLVNSPNLALSKSIAFEIMTLGMTKGIFTGKKLSDFFGPDRKDYKNARRIINGTDKAALLAAYAEQFEQILNDSLSTDSTNPAGLTPSEQPANVSVETSADPSPAKINEAESGDGAALNSDSVTEKTVSAEKETTQGTLKSEVTSKNEQSVNDTVKMDAPEPYNGIGFWATIKSDLAKLGIGNGILQTASEWAEKAKDLPEILQALIVKFAYIALIGSAVYLLFRAIHFAIDSWKKAHKVRLEAEINSDITRKNMEWTNL